MPQSNAPSVSLAALREGWAAGTRSKGRAHRRILDAAEQLLASTSLHELKVEQILAKAGVSRPTFYSYFGSKLDVVAALYARASGQVYDAVRPLYERDEGETPAAAVARAMTQLAEAWIPHRAMFGAAIEHRHASTELRQATLTELGYYVDTLAGRIDADRSAGLAPAGPDARTLASTLLWSTEHTLYIAGTATDPNLPDERAAVPALTAMWLNTIYGHPHPQED